MKFCSVWLQETEQAAIIVGSKILPIVNINKASKHHFPTNLVEIIKKGAIKELQRVSGKFGEYGDQHFLAESDVKYLPLFTNPSKIWGIGLNYQDHAKDLDETAPESIPASFMKPNTTIIGYEDTIKLPLLSDKITGEAELGIVIGSGGKNIGKNNWLDHVAGFCCILDMTAEDILRRNPRYLTLSKSFDSFFSFGPHLITPDEIEDLDKMTVSTVLNSQVHAENLVGNMRFSPSFLVSFHSQVMRLLPGDIISTGTPRAVELNHGDLIECAITGFKPLLNHVFDLKK